MPSGNPFFNRSAITDPTQFYGRGRELRAITTMLQNAQCCSIVGERRMGKSSLLHTLMDESVRQRFGLDPQETLFVFLNFEGKIDLTPSDFWRFLLGRIAGRIHDPNLKTDIRDLRSQDTIRFFDVETLMYDITDEGLKLVCLFDEFDYTAACEELDFNFFSSLRSLANSFRIAYVTASHSNLVQLQYSKEVLVSPFFNIFREIPLGVFPQEEACELIRGNMEKTTVSFSEEDQAFLCSLSGCHPFFLQMACFHLFETYQEQTDVTESRHAYAGRAFLEEAIPHFQYAWEKSDPESRETLIQLVRNAGKPMVPNLEIRILDRLQKRGLVISTAESHRIFSPMFAQWVQEEVNLPVGGVTTLPEPPFVPIRNPYIVGNPITSHEMFYGREDDFQYVRTKLQNGRGGIVIVFAGERRSGKTSILHQILHGKLGPGFESVLLDMQAMVVNSENEFYEKLATEIAQRCGGDEVTLDDYDFFEQSRNPARTFERFIESVLHRVSPRQLLLLFDEYELLGVNIDEGILDNGVLTFFASLLERHPQLSAIFTGSRHLEQREEPYWKILMGKAICRRVTFLSERDTHRLVLDPVQDLVNHESGVPEAIFRLTAGQPFYTQVICQNLIDLVNENKNPNITLSLLDQVVTEFVVNPLPQIIYFWDSLGAEQQLALALLAELLETPDATVTVPELLGFMAEEVPERPLTRTALLKSLEALRIRDVLVRPERECYQYRVDLFRYWISHEHSLWQLLDEWDEPLSQVEKIEDRRWNPEDRR